MTTPTGYKFTFNGEEKDFADVFEEEALNGLNLTEYNFNGNPLGSLFRGGNGGFTTNYTLNGVDLGVLCEAKLPFTSSGHTLFGTTDNYAYAVFTDVNSTGIIRARYYDEYYPLAFVVVGGGGGGGRSVGGQSNGGGGGGGVYSFTQRSDMFDKDLLVTVGGGGTSSTATNQTGGTGGDSYIRMDGTDWFKSTGGGGGSPSTRGSGGESIRYGMSTNYENSNGGDGGDQSNGNNASYYQGGLSLSIPSELLTLSLSDYISNYYSGGGGGAKGSADDFNWSGGRGGSENRDGVGGTRGVLDSPGSTGQEGQYWGAGGGAGGNSSGGTRYDGGPGKQGIVVVYAQIKKASILSETLPFVSSGSTKQGIAGNYIYAIFTDTTIGGTVTATTYNASKPLYFIVVGGGGGGGGSKEGVSNGGGGGGGVYKFTQDGFNIGTYTLTLNVGEGGLGGEIGSSGTNGKDSTISKSGIPTAIFTSGGGGAGTNTSAGSSGSSSDINGINYSNSTGGGGGDQANGENAYYYPTGPALDIPQELIDAEPNYISFYYSGGGGGGKADNESNSWGGGQGGNNGVGGARTSGIGSDGASGVSYGSGGGAGGINIAVPPALPTYYKGGSGKQGIIIVYALK